MKKITKAQFLKAIDGFSPRIKFTGKKLRGTFDNVRPLSRKANSVQKPILKLKKKKR